MTPEPMRLFSVFQVDCLCGEPVRTSGATAVCSHCGREINLESWQVQHTMTAQGLVMRNPKR